MTSHPKGDPLVVVGASLSGLRAVEAARAGGYTGRIILVGAEPHLPYDRPPLSKQFLQPDSLPDHLASEEVLRDVLGVDLRLSSVATDLDPDARTVTVNGEQLSYSSLVIATGAVPRTLPFAGGLTGVVTLRTLDDAIDLRERLSSGKRVVIIGAGFIGSEIASSAKAKGADVVILEAAPAPLVRALGEEVGRAVSSLHERNGVRLLLSAQVEGLDSNVGAVVGVRLASREVIPADVVVIGVGAAPATAWLRSSGILLSDLDGGVICDEFLRTTAPGVYAAGDVAHFPNVIMDGSMRLENWTNAADQGRQAARNALWPEAAKPYETVPYFWSDWYGHRIQFVGSAVADEVRFVSGSSDDDRWVALYRQGDRIIGAATVNEPRRTMKYRRMIADRTSWDVAVEAFSMAQG